MAALGKEAQGPFESARPGHHLWVVQGVRYEMPSVYTLLVALRDT